MASSIFKIKEYTIPCQHIRHYPRATLHSQEEVLHLAVKQYTPLDNPDPRPGDVTIIGAHANGFPKELYEPLWVDIHARAKAAGFRIRNIWIADVSHQGWSGVLNEGKLGDDPSWFDHSRDLLHLINHFRAEMVRPLIGIGHSMGGCQLTNLSLMHPRLLEGLVLIDPVIMEFNSAHEKYSPAAASAMRREVWPSRKAAEESFKRSKFYQAWDPRVLDAWVKHGLRDLPTRLFPKNPPGLSSKNSTALGTAEPAVAHEPAPPVTLTTTKHQEVFTFMRPNYPPEDNPDAPGTHQLTIDNPIRNWVTHPDITPLSVLQSPFYRPEALITFRNLPHLRPSVLYIFGDESYISAEKLRADKMRVTGVGVGGNGGAAEGRVKEYVMKGVGHLIPMERVGDTADQCTTWIAAELVRWKKHDEESFKVWEGKPIDQRYQLSRKFLEQSGVPKEKL